MRTAQLRELLLQALEHEMGGVQVYRTAIECALNDDLHEEWQRYLKQTQNHVRVLTYLCEVMGIDSEDMTPGREVVHAMGKSLVKAMRMAQESGDRAACELVACDCVFLAETKDHANWQLLSECAKGMVGEAGDAMKDACDQIEDEEDEHLYNSRGWGRELWLKSLGIQAFLPPPEERQHVKSAVGAFRAEKMMDLTRRH